VFAAEVGVQAGDGSPATVLVLEVPVSEFLHVTTGDVCYLRVGDETRKLTFHQRQELAYDRGASQYDARPARDVSIADLDPKLLRNYSRTLGVSGPERTLTARNLLTRDGSVTIAADLLFGLRPQGLHPEALVRILRYRGSERGSGVRQQLEHDVSLGGPIVRLLDEAMQRIRPLVPSRRSLGPGNRFRSEPIVPEAAWVEAVVNAVVHRSYSLGGDHVRVEIFDDRLEVESPGRFPGLARLDDPRRVRRYSRNPRIARVCADHDFGQELGEGIRRIFDEMRLANLVEPLYRQTEQSVRLVLAATPVSVEMAAGLPERSREVLELLRAAGAAGTGDIALSMGVSRPHVLRRLNALQEAELIERVGKSPKDPRAYWRLRVE
jgi:ATP-dependent DNA helicase RecG